MVRKSPSRSEHIKMNHEYTPSLSPGSTRLTAMEDVQGGYTVRKIDLEGIHDEVVQAVIIQLHATANRPHQIKELATALSQQLPSVQQYVFRVQIP